MPKKLSMGKNASIAADACHRSPVAHRAQRRIPEQDEEEPAFQKHFLLLDSLNRRVDSSVASVY